MRSSGAMQMRYHKLSFTIGEKGDYPKEYWRQLFELCDIESKTGIICDTDAVARDVIDFLTARKIAIPDQVAIIGAGDLPLYTMQKPLQLSTVAWPLERMGREAVRRLLVQKDIFDSSVRIIMDTKLMLRDTTLSSCDTLEEYSWRGLITRNLTRTEHGRNTDGTRTDTVGLLVRVPSIVHRPLSIYLSIPVHPSILSFLSIVITVHCP